jgi:hypothetical protein
MVGVITVMAKPSHSYRHFPDVDFGGEMVSLCHLSIVLLCAAINPV